MYKCCFDRDPGSLAVRMKDLCGVPEIHAVTWIAVVPADGAKDQRVSRNMFNHSVVYKFTGLTNIYLWTG